MMHAIAFSQSQDAAGVLSFQAGVPDPTVRVSGNDIYVPNGVNKLIGALGCAGATATQLQLLSPSLRRTQPYDIRPVQLALVPTGAEPIYLHEDSPIQLDYNEALNAKISSDPAAAEQASTVVFLTDSVPQKVTGAIVKTRFQITGAVTAGQWVNMAITFPDLLPVGVWSCIGAMLVASGVVAARWFPIGQAWRPGFPVHQTLGDRQDFKFRNGFLGKWFDFDQTQPPTIDVLASATAGSATYTGVMDLVKAGS